MEISDSIQALENQLEDVNLKIAALEAVRDGLSKFDQDLFQKGATYHRWVAALGNVRKIVNPSSFKKAGLNILGALLNDQGLSHSDGAEIIERARRIRFPRSLPSLREEWLPDARQSYLVSKILPVVLHYASALLPAYQVERGVIEKTLGETPKDVAPPALVPQPHPPEPQVVPELVEDPIMERMRRRMKEIYSTPRAAPLESGVISVDAGVVKRVLEEHFRSVARKKGGKLSVVIDDDGLHWTVFIGSEEHATGECSQVVDRGDERFRKARVTEREMREDDF